MTWTLDEAGEGQTAESAGSERASSQQQTGPWRGFFPRRRSAEANPFPAWSGRAASSWGRRKHSQDAVLAETWHLAETGVARMRSEQLDGQSR